MIRPEQLSELDSTLLHVPGEDTPSGKAFERQRDLVRLLRLSIDGTDYLISEGDSPSLNVLNREDYPLLR